MGNKNAEDSNKKKEETKESTNSKDKNKAQNISNKGYSYSEPKAIKSDAENKSTVTYKVNEEAGAVRASFTSADKSAAQNAGREDAEDKKEFIKDKPYTKDPSEAVLVNREYENEGKKEKGLYANSTVRFDGFEPNKGYTIAIEAEYKYTDKNGKTQSENVLVFYDMKSDKDGTIIAERLAALAFNDENMPIVEAEVTLNFYSLEGRVNDNFPDVASYTQDTGNKYNLNCENNPTVAKSLISHARSGEYDDNGNIQENNQGGAYDGDLELLNQKGDRVFLNSLNIKLKR